MTMLWEESLSNQNLAKYLVREVFHRRAVDPRRIIIVWRCKYGICDGSFKSLRSCGDSDAIPVGCTADTPLANDIALSLLPSSNHYSIHNALALKIHQFCFFNSAQTFQVDATVLDFLHDCNTGVTATQLQAQRGRD